MNKKIGLFIPTYNAVTYSGNRFAETLFNIRQAELDRVLIIDSSSKDNTVELVKSFGFEIKVIPQAEFDHGGTRQLAMEMLSNCDIVIFITQDAYIQDIYSLKRLIQPLIDNPDLGAAYGRQVAFDNANIFAKHLRIYNYKTKSQLISYPDRYSRGMRSVFASNAFSAYNVKKVLEVGGFPNNLILGEDVFIFAKLLIAGFKVKYVADSFCYHSHDYSLKEEFRRYFDIGVFHRTNKWIIEHFGNADSDGFKYIFSEFIYVMRRQPLKIHISFIKNLVKFTGYKLGYNYRLLPKKLRRKLSMTKTYWDTKYRGD